MLSVSSSALGFRNPVIVIIPLDASTGTGTVCTGTRPRHTVPVPQYGKRTREPADSCDMLSIHVVREIYYQFYFRWNVYLMI